MIRLVLAGLVIPLLVGPVPQPTPQPPPTPQPTTAPQPTTTREPTTTSQPTATPQPTTTSFSDGGVSMSVAVVDCDHPTPTGQDCYLTIHMVNVSDGFPIFTEGVQTVYDPAGRAFHPDPAATADANGGKQVTQQLPRGVPITGMLVFPMPAGDRIDHIVLHGRPDSPGMTFVFPPQ